MCSDENSSIILSSGTAIYLHKPWEHLLEQFGSLKNRPVLKSNSEFELEKLFYKRLPYYRRSQLTMPMNTTFSTQKLAQTLRLSTNR